MKTSLKEFRQQLREYFSQILKEQDPFAGSGDPAKGDWTMSAADIARNPQMLNVMKKISQKRRTQKGVAPPSGDIEADIAALPDVFPTAPSRPAPAPKQAKEPTKVARPSKPLPKPEPAPTSFKTSPPEEPTFVGAKPKPSEKKKY